MDKKIWIILLIVIAIAALAVYFIYSAGKNKPADSGVGGVLKKISAEEAKKMIDAGGVTIVDVRRRDEFDAGHISGAVLVPVESITSQAPSALPDKNAVLLIYCRSGNRSATAAQRLHKLGYTNVYDFGGIIDWPYEIVK